MQHLYKQGTRQNISHVEATNSKLLAFTRKTDIKMIHDLGLLVVYTFQVRNNKEGKQESEEGQVVRLVAVYFLHTRYEMLDPEVVE